MTRSFSRSSEIFTDAMVLDEEYQPEELRERDEELDQLQRSLQPVIDNRPLSNIFIYGKTGTGKTVATRYILDLLQRDARDYDDIDLSVVWVGCEQLTSSYQVAVALVNEIRDMGNQISTTGYSQQAVFNMLYQELDEIGGTILLVLDEIDNIGNSDEILYGLPRARANGYVEVARPLVIGISNDFNFKDQLSPKVRDTLCEEEILFPPYDANELREILFPRAEQAFKDGVLEDDVIPLVAALAAQDSGSARQAIRLLYLTGKLSAQRDKDIVTTDIVRESKEELDTSKIVEGMQRLTTQGHCVLLTLASHASKDETPVRTKNIYGRYEAITEQINADTIVNRRVRAHLNDLSMLGIVDVYERNEGLRDGRYYEYELNVVLDSVLDALADALADEQRFADVVETIREQAHVNNRLSNFS